MTRFMHRTSRKKRKNLSHEDFSIELFNDLDQNLDNLHKMLDSPEDLNIRVFTIGESKTRCAIVYIDGLIDRDLVQNILLENFQNRMRNKETSNETDFYDDIYKELVSITKIEKGKTLDDVSNAILSGSVVFYLDGIDKVLLIDAKGGESRSIEQPVTETLIRGPRTSFVENIGTNIALIRRYIRDPNVRFKSHQIGRRSKQTLVVAYVDGIVNPEIVNEVNRRLQTIDIDVAPESGFIEQWIQDSFLSPFSQISETERPDMVSAALLKGKVAILLEGTPFVLLVPITIADTFRSTEDYYERWLFGTLLRLLRYFAAILALFLPGLYIALVSYHQGLLPSKLAFSIAAAREGIPFSPAVEAILMVITLELLQEAGIRLPTPIGQTIGIVGGLVLGQAAVQAGIVSPIMIIIVALTAIAAYAVPTFSLGIALRVLRFAFIFAATIFGLYGIILVYIMVNIHMVNLTSIGVPYSTPFAPTFLKDFKDLIVRAPSTLLTNRPEYLKPEDETIASKGDGQS